MTSSTVTCYWYPSAVVQDDNEATMTETNKMRSAVDPNQMDRARFVVQGGE
jgi:hypothetical protein